MENIVRTAYGSALQTSLFSGIPYVMQANTTLNEKFGILAGVAPAEGITPVAKYYCIGNAGHQLASGTGGIPLIESVQHTAEDAALYNHLPFILRATNNDISSSVQASYALRKQIVVNGLNYFAYYLKRIDTSAAVTNVTLQTNNGGTITSTNFVPTSANLSPTPPVVNSVGTNLLLAQYLNCSATLPISLTQQECTELLNAALILYGDVRYAIISEMAICSGVDRIITLGNGSSFNEAIAVQVASFISSMHVIQFTSTGINGTFNLGTSDPALTLT